MSKEMEFLVFAVEYYRGKKNMSGREIAHSFSAHRVYRMILDNYFLYHIESPEHFVAEIDAVIGDHLGK